MDGRVSLRTGLVALVVGALLLALVPAGLVLNRRLSTELEQEARSDLAMAPEILADRAATRADALMMHAKEVAGAGGLVAAVARGDSAGALAVAGSAVPAPEERPLVVTSSGRAWGGVPVAPSLLRETRDGRMPVAFVHAAGSLYRLSLAPLSRGGEWVGAAGVFAPMDRAAAATLAGLTRSEVAFFGPEGRAVVATADSAILPVISDSLASWRDGGDVREIRLDGGRRYWTAVGPLGEAGTAVFVRDAARELAVLPGLRRSAVLAGLLVLGLTGLLALAFAGRMARPVRALAEASRRLADGEFGIPVPPSRIREIDRVSRAFRSMRDALSEKIRQLTGANRQLEDRQERLQALQSELIQRDRLAATGRLVTELAHEIRNPVASVRNCLEIIHRRLEDEELREFSGMAIEELLRMHRLAETMLDANRPLDPDADRCDPARVAAEVAELAGTAAGGDGPSVVVEGSVDVPVAMGPDALKQVLLNLVENAREAVEDAGPEGGGRIRLVVGRGPAAAQGDGGGSGSGDRGPTVLVEVLDEGPGIDPPVRERIFDPFFTTKDQVHGVGLGLFVAEGLVRRHGGRISAANRREGGARFSVELPVAASGANGESGPETEARG